MKPLPAGHTAVMASRIEPPDSLDFFPTPPWASRALCEHVLPLVVAPVFMRPMSVWCPAAGEGHMAEVLREYFAAVHASDVHNYGRGYKVGSFVGEGPDVAQCPFTPDWIIENPPFRLAQEFIERGLREARVGVAMLLRTAFIETDERYEFYQRHPLAIFAPFAERVAMTKGVWNPGASTATSYSWFVWLKDPPSPQPPRVFIIPYGCKKALTRFEDIKRFAGTNAACPLFDAVPAEDDEQHQLATAVAAFGG